MRVRGSWWPRRCWPALTAGLEILGSRPVRLGQSHLRRQLVPRERAADLAGWRQLGVVVEARKSSSEVILDAPSSELATSGWRLARITEQALTHSIGVPATPWTLTFVSNVSATIDIQKAHLTASDTMSMDPPTNSPNQVTLFKRTGE